MWSVTTALLQIKSTSSKCAPQTKNSFHNAWNSILFGYPIASENVSDFKSTLLKSKYGWRESHI